MAISINELTSGIGLILDGEIYAVVEYHHVKPGKGSAFARVRLKNIKTNAVLERTFRSSETLEDIHLEEKKMQYLYTAGELYYFMDHGSYEEVVVTADLLGDGSKFLLENLEVVGLCYNDKVLKVIMPNFIIAQVKESEPGIRGDSTKSGGKPAKIETGTAIQVPLFINVDDWIRIDTRTGQYVERVQK